MCLSIQASLRIVRLSDLFCAWASEREEGKEKGGKCRGSRGYVCLCVCHQIIKKCQVVSGGSLMWVWWGPPLPVPSPLVLISQVDEHISSNPNPSPCIAPHMSRRHSNGHTQRHTGKHSWTQMCTYERAMSTDAWKLGGKGEKNYRSEAAWYLCSFIPGKRRKGQWHTHILTHTEMNQTFISLDLTALKLSYILSQPCLCTSQAFLLILTALHPLTDLSMSLTAGGRSSLRTGHQPKVKSSILTFMCLGISEKAPRQHFCY